MLAEEFHHLSSFHIASIASCTSECRHPCWCNLRYCFQKVVYNQCALYHVPYFEGFRTSRSLVVFAKPWLPILRVSHGLQRFMVPFSCPSDFIFEVHSHCCLEICDPGAKGSVFFEAAHLEVWADCCIQVPYHRRDIFAFLSVVSFADSV